MVKRKTIGSEMPEIARMRQTASSARKPKRRRLDPTEREREIIEGAVAFFAEVGFDGGLRDLAQRIGTTHQNLLRYFPTKEALIERVYEEVYLNRWQPEWEALLHKSDRSLEDRLVAFYEDYLAAIFNYEWVRIFVFAGLKGVDITQRYLGLIQSNIIEPLARELMVSEGKEGKPSPLEMEVALALHGEMFYLAIRRWVYALDTPQDLGAVIRMSVIRFLEGAPAAMKKVPAAERRGLLPKAL